MLTVRVSTSKKSLFETKRNKNNRWWSAYCISKHSSPSREASNAASSNVCEQQSIEVFCTRSILMERARRSRKKIEERERGERWINTNERKISNFLPKYHRERMKILRSRWIISTHWTFCPTRRSFVRNRLTRQQRRAHSNRCCDYSCQLCCFMIEWFENNVFV